jgi:hypothetical protein
MARNSFFIGKLYMIHILETLGVLKDKKSGDFKMLPAILMMLLILTFMGATVYILVSSLQY